MDPGGILLSHNYLVARDLLDEHAEWNALPREEKSIAFVERLLREDSESVPSLDELFEELVAGMRER